MDQSRKYTWVVQTLRDCGRLSLKQLNKKWVKMEMSNGLPIPRQTFERWRGAIGDLFGVDIECDRKDGYRYYIGNPDALLDSAVKNWVLESFSALNAVSSNFQLMDRILVEDIPSSRDYLADILEAMKLGRVVRLIYRGFGKSRSFTFPLAPYCVKLFQTRWYLLGYSVDEDKMRLYALDRIEGLEITGERFEYPQDFDPKEWFSSYFGIVLDETVESQRVVLKVVSPHRDYMRTLPMHHSQKEIRIEDDFSVFELHLRPTFDFCMELFKAGTWIEVLEPQSLKERLGLWAKDLCEMYRQD